MSKDVIGIDVAAIVGRIKEAYGLKRNADVARHLGMEARSDPIGKAIKRNRLDLINVVQACSDLNQDWLLYGRGEMYPPRMQPVDLSKASHADTKDWLYASLQQLTEEAQRRIQQEREEEERTKEE